MFADRQAYGISDCNDGSSNTVAFSEGLIGDGSTATLNGAEYYNCVPWPTGTNTGQGSGADQLMPNALTNLQSYIASCNAMKTKSPTGNLNDRNEWWAAGRGTEGPIAPTLLTPNSPNMDCNNYQYSTLTERARSRHPGGVDILMADGSVRFLKNSVTQTTWWALGTKAGGEVLDQSSY